MPDTLKTRAQLLTALADNTSGAIGAQTMRDLLVSLWVHGSIRLDTTQNQVIGSPATKYGDFESAGPLAGVTADTSLDRLTVGVSGIFRVSFSFSFSTAGNTGGPFVFEVRKNGTTTPENGLRASAFAKVSGATLNLAASDVLSLTAGDYLEVWHSFVGGSQIATFTSACLAVDRVG